ncbi:hypothetical protein Tco_1335467, partial [Tanacetum coccineum]
GVTPSASTGTNKGKCPLIPKNRGRPAKRVSSSIKGGSSGGATKIGGSRGSLGVVLGMVLRVVLGAVQAKEVDVQAKEVEVLTLYHSKV